MRFVKRLLYFIPIFAIFLMSENTFALQQTSFTVLWRSYAIDNGALVNQQGFINNPVLGTTLLTYEAGHSKYLYGFSAEFPVDDQSNYTNKQVLVKVTVGQSTNPNLVDYNSWVTNLTNSYIGVDTNLGIGPNFGGCTGARKTNSLVEYTCRTSLSNGAKINYVQARIGKVENATNSDQIVGQTCGNDIAPWCYTSLNIQKVEYELSGSNDPTFQQLEVLDQHVIDMSNSIDERNQKEYDAVDNIDNQNSSDIDGAENQQTDNLIGIISSFVTALSSFSATDCNLNLPLPAFVGGNTSVNICQGKDILGNFITLFSTLTVLLFYVPLAWLLLKMIYNEIRSWTNG